MEQTTQKHYKITKNTAILGQNSFEGRCLYLSLVDKEQFLDYLEDIYENLTPDKVETLGEYDKMFVAEHEYQAVKDLEVDVNAEEMQIIITWSEIIDEDGTVYGKSFFKNAKLERVLDFMQAYDKADQETKILVEQILRENQLASF